MDRAYDIFEVLSDGISIWKASIDDEEGAMRKLDELATGKSRVPLNPPTNYGNHSHQKWRKELVPIQ